MVSLFEQPDTNTLECCESKDAGAKQESMASDFADSRNIPKCLDQAMEHWYLYYLSLSFPCWKNKKRLGARSRSGEKKNCFAIFWDFRANKRSLKTPSGYISYR